MKRKNKQPQNGTNTLAVTQTGNNTHPFYHLNAYMPLTAPDMQLYKSLREAVPIIDASIFKLIRLLGTFEVVTHDKAAQKELNSFLSSVSVDSEREGIDAFIATYFEQLLTYGTAIGEMVVSNGRFSYLHNADLKTVSLSHGKSELDVVVSADNGFGRFLPVKYPSLILTSVHNPEPGKVYGNSILKGLPFVSDILLKIYNTIGVNWERVGNVRYSVTYKPQGDSLDKAYAAERAKQVAAEWSKAMNSSGSVKDFVAVGDVEIKAIGADNQILDSNVPARQMLEQIVAKLGIPPFLLGLSWSTTERMSYQQADILTSEIDAYRREITPVIRKICSLWLRLNGYSCGFDIQWDNVTLQDITEMAKSELYKAQTQKIYQETGGEVLANS